MVLYGRTYRVGDGIGTDAIIAPHARADDPALLAAHCLETVDAGLAEAVQAGDMLVAGSAFGAGDDPEIAVLALQALGFAAIVCVSAVPGFQELAHIYGLPVLCCEAAGRIGTGVTLRIDLERGLITDRTNDQHYQVAPAAPELLAAVRRNELLLRMRQVVEEEGFDG